MRAIGIIGQGTVLACLVGLCVIAGRAGAAGPARSTWRCLKRPGLRAKRPLAASPLTRKRLPRWRRVLRSALAFQSS